MILTCYSKVPKILCYKKNLASTMVLLASESDRERVYMGATAALSTPCDL